MTVVLTLSSASDVTVLRVSTVTIGETDRLC